MNWLERVGVVIFTLSFWAASGAVQAAGFCADFQRRLSSLAPGACARADLKAKSLLLMSIRRLGYFERRALREFLFKYPELNEVYDWKEVTK